MHDFVPNSGRSAAFLWSTFDQAYIMAVMDFEAFAGTFPRSGRRTASAGDLIDSHLCRMLVRLRNRHLEVDGTMQADRNLASSRAELSKPRPALECGMRRRGRRSRWLA